MNKSGYNHNFAYLENMNTSEIHGVFNYDSIKPIKFLQNDNHITVSKKRYCFGEDGFVYEINDNTLVMARHNQPIN